MITMLEIHRRRQGFTQKQLAERVGYCNTMISKYERGFTVRVSKKFKEKVSRELKIGEDRLFSKYVGGRGLCPRCGL